MAHPCLFIGKPSRIGRELYCRSEAQPLLTWGGEHDELANRSVRSQQADYRHVSYACPAGRPGSSFAKALTGSSNAPAGTSEPCRKGVDAVMFSNEASLPYLTEVEPITYVTMARVIGELRCEIKVPYGVNVLWDPKASIDLAMATGAQFVREIFSGVYASDFGLWNTNCGQVVRHQHAIHAEHVKLLFNIVPEAASYLGTATLLKSPDPRFSTTVLMCSVSPG